MYVGIGIAGEMYHLWLLTVPELLEQLQNTR